MKYFLSKPAVLLLTWYQKPNNSYCRLIPMHVAKDVYGDEILVAAPTVTQTDLIVYPEDDAANAGHFFCCNGGRLIHLN